MRIVVTVGFVPPTPSLAPGTGKSKLFHSIRFTAAKRPSCGSWKRGSGAPHPPKTPPVAVGVAHVLPFTMSCASLRSGVAIGFVTSTLMETERFVSMLDPRPVVRRGLLQLSRMSPVGSSKLV